MMTMFRRLSFAGALALLAATASAAPPAGDETMYYRTYYDDAAMTQEVGRDQDVCTNNGLWSTPVEGRYGRYVQSEAFAVCRNGQTIFF